MKSVVKISNKVHNAIMLLGFIKKNRRSKYATPISLISKNLNLSFSYLEEIAYDLKKAGVIKSYRGSAGGYRLAKKKITIFDIIEAIEKPEWKVGCEKTGVCKVEENCPSKHVWFKFQKELIKTLKNIDVV